MQSFRLAEAVLWALDACFYLAPQFSIGLFSGTGGTVQAVDPQSKEPLLGGGEARTGEI